MSGFEIMILAVASLGAFFMLTLSLANKYNLNNIKDKTVGHGQHGTARWTTKKEIRRTYKHLHYNPQLWRIDPNSRPTEQGIVVGCKTMNCVRFANFIHKLWYVIRRIARFYATNMNPDKERKEIQNPIPQNTTGVMVDTGDVHALMIGAAGVGKTAYWLYPCIEYACASGMSWLSTDTKGDVMRNYGNIAQQYGYHVSVIDLRNPTRSNGNNLLHLVNKYMDLYP